jgi:hypothetical protein
LRGQKILESLARPWKVRKPGLQALEDWVAVKGGAAEEQKAQGFLMFGAILGK